MLNDLGLGYLTWVNRRRLFPAAKAQRIKIATEMSKLQRAKHTVYILDELTVSWVWPIPRWRRDGFERSKARTPRHIYTDQELQKLLRSKRAAPLDLRR